MVGPHAVWGDRNQCVTPRAPIYCHTDIYARALGPFASKTDLSDSHCPAQVIPVDQALAYVCKIRNQATGATRSPQDIGNGDWAVPRGGVLEGYVELKAEMSTDETRSYLAIFFLNLRMLAYFSSP